MNDPRNHLPHRRTHGTAREAACLEFDLPAEIHRLKAESTWSTGHNAKTLIRYDDLRVVLMALQPGARVPEHQADGRVSVQVLVGHVQVRAAGRTFSLRVGGLLALDRGVRHDVTALEESAFLLTIAWPGKT
jgi:quercetin dioxygenase-like cupin family protein